MSSADLVAPGGTLVYSVCTLTAAETTKVLDAIGADLGSLWFQTSGKRSLTPHARPGRHVLFGLDS